MEYLVTMTTDVPEGTPGETVDAVRGRARDGAEMEAIVKSPPLDSLMTAKITPLTAHPSEPVVTGT